MNNNTVCIDFNKVSSQETLNKYVKALNPYSKKYNFEDKLKKASSRLNEMEFKISVVANMSSGKSTFINALFGDIILPALNEATTDCATFIFSDDIKENNRAIIYFEDDKETITIHENDVKSEIKLYAKKDSDELEEKYKKVKYIDLHWDFDVLKNTAGMKFKFTFIDTPGPNNTGDFEEKHKSVTNMIIREQSDLVIFLFDYGQIDANLQSDEQGLWQILIRRSESDKFFDIFFVINKIDMSIEDDEKTDQERGTHKQKAFQKLETTAKNHGFKNPKIFGVSAQLASFYKMKNKGLFKINTPGYNFAQKAYKKALFDFNDDHNPESALLNFSEIEKLENEVMTYIQKTIENKLVNKVRWEIEGIIKEIENIIQQEVKVLEQNSGEAEKNLNKGLDFLEKNIPPIYDRLHKSLLNLKNSFISKCEKLIDENSQKYLLDQTEEIITRSWYTTFYLLTQHKTLKQAKRDAELVDITEESFSKFKLGSNSYDFKTKDPSITAEKILSKIKCFALEKISDSLIEISNAYKIALKKEYKNLVLEINKSYLIIINEFNKNLSKKLGTNELEFKIINETNIPPIQFDIPVSCIETMPQVKEIRIQNGVREKEVEKNKQYERSWFNPLKYNPFDWENSTYYTKKEKHRIKTPIFKKIIEKNYSYTINCDQIYFDLKDKINNSITIWKEDDLTQLNESIDNITKEFLLIFEEVEKNKKLEINELQNKLTERESNLKIMIKEFEVFKQTIEQVVVEN